VVQVKRVTDLIAEISSASVEQTQGIDQVGEAVTQLDQVTQQNAALVEESAAAAESLKQQATSNQAGRGRGRVKAEHVRSCSRRTHEVTPAAAAMGCLRMRSNSGAPKFAMNSSAAQRPRPGPRSIKCKF
jgi:hypothetical protein